LTTGETPRTQFVVLALSVLSCGPLLALVLGSYQVSRNALFASSLCAVTAGSLDPTSLAGCAIWATAKGPSELFIAAAWLVSLAVAIVTAIVQGSLTFAPGAVGPRLARLSLTIGVKRLLNVTALTGAGMSALVITALGAATWRPLAQGIAAAATSQDLTAALATMMATTKALWLRVLGIIAAFALADTLLARKRFSASLRMTPREIKEERMQTEARPEAKQRRKMIGLRRSRSLRIEAIKTATAIVTNPQHLAIALRYAPPEIDVPVVVARGADLSAIIVRQAAREHDVPIIESAELARTLYARVDVDEPIPEECYAAVAAVFAWIVRTRGSLRTGFSNSV